MNYHLDYARLEYLPKLQHQRMKLLNRGFALATLPDRSNNRHCPNEY